MEATYTVAVPLVVAAVELNWMFKFMPHKLSPNSSTRHTKWETSKFSFCNSLIILISSFLAGCVPSLPFRRRPGGGDQAAAVISGWAGVSFVIFNMLAFSTAFSVVFLDKRPDAARALRLSAAVFMSTALLLLPCAVSF